MGPLLGPETRHRILFLSRKSLRNCYKAVDLLCDMIRFAFVFFLRCICECMHMCITEVGGVLFIEARDCFVFFLALPLIF